MSTSSVPALFAGLVDDAAAVRAGRGPHDRALGPALAEYARRRRADHAALFGPLVVPVSGVPDLLRAHAAQPSGTPEPIGTPEPTGSPGPDDGPAPAQFALLADTGGARLAGAVAAVRAAGMAVRQVEVAVAKRGQDPLPGLHGLLADLPPGVDVYAEIPLTWGLTEALDGLAEARSSGRPVLAKFRTGGLAAELYPTPSELAGVIVACRERAVPFKLTAGLRRAVRHNDPETGFTHHGFLNVLGACLLAAGGAGMPAVTECLATTGAIPLTELARAHRGDDRPLWTSFATSAVNDPLTDLIALGLLR